MKFKICINVKFYMKAIMKFRIFCLLSIIVMISAACSAGISSERQTTQLEEPRTLSVMTHDSFAISEDVIDSFQNLHNVEIKFLASGDTGSAVNKAALSKSAPLADIFYGVDNTFLSRALEEDIFDQYNSPSLENVPNIYKLDPQNRAIPVDFGDVCLNYDINFFKENDLEPPTSLEDLLKSEYQGLLVVENPATSSPGLAFLFATIGHFGVDGYLDYWKGLVDNEVKVVNDWETAYYSEFSRWGGQYPIVVSYGSSPSFEVIFSEDPIDEPPTAAVTSDGSCFRQIEFVGILKGTENRDLAEKFIDFMLSPNFQADIPLQMFVFPVIPETKLNPVFEKYLAVPENPVYLNPADIATNREIWINTWTETVLR
jgi:thiamine transport system substrate-binding protein